MFHNASDEFVEYVLLRSGKPQLTLSNRDSPWCSAETIHTQRMKSQKSQTQKAEHLGISIHPMLWGAVRFPSFADTYRPDSAAQTHTFWNQHGCKNAWETGTKQLPMKNLSQMLDFVLDYWKIGGKFGEDKDEDLWSFFYIIKNLVWIKIFYSNSQLFAWEFSL